MCTYLASEVAAVERVRGARALLQAELHVRHRDSVRVGQRAAEHHDAARSPLELHVLAAVSERSGHLSTGEAES